jgi:hypothetical protein
MKVCRRVEVGYDDAINEVRITRVSDWATNIKEELDSSVSEYDRLCDYQAISARISQHRQASLTRREGPTPTRLHDLERLPVVMQSDPREWGSLIDDEHGPVARRHVLKTPERRNQRPRVPKRAPITCDLNLQSGSDLLHVMVADLG